MEHIGSIVLPVMWLEPPLISYRCAMEVDSDFMNILVLKWLDYMKHFPR